MESRQRLERNQIGVLDESMKQNLDHLLLIERLLTEQPCNSPFSFKSWWTSLKIEEPHTNTSYKSHAAKDQSLLNQQEQQHTPKEYLDEITRQLNTSTDRIKQLEQEIQRYKDDYSKLEQKYSKQRSIDLEKQLESRSKQDQLERVMADLNIKHKQEKAIKERLENQLDDVLTQCDLKVKGYQQNIKEMQAIIDHNEELELFNSASQLNNEKYHELEVEIERLQVENNDYRNRLDQIDQQERLSDKEKDMETHSNAESWSDNNESNGSSKHASFSDGEAYLDQQHKSSHNSIPLLASRSTSMLDPLNNVLRTEMDHAIALKNDELDVLSTKNSELEVELKQAMETIDFLRRQHQDDRETIKKLSDNNMIYLDQIKLLSEENKNLTFQQ
jgi:predicted RNase H-like nuclease (RuvC/YqgF family)